VGGLNLFFDPFLTRVLPLSTRREFPRVHESGAIITVYNNLPEPENGGFFGKKTNRERTQSSPEGRREEEGE